jgi:acetyl esterase/lipase
VLTTTPPCAACKCSPRRLAFPTGAFVADFEAADLFFLHEWVRRANATVVYVTYEFAPQAPFPTGLEQVMTSDDL